MIKSHLTSLLLSGIIGILFTSCICKDVPGHWKATEAELSLLSEKYSYELMPDDVFTEDTLLLLFEFTPLIVASKKPSFLNGLFFSQAYATSPCPQEGYEGLKHEITGFNITCSSDFSGIPAGESLNHLLISEVGDPVTTSDLNLRLIDYRSVVSTFGVFLERPYTMPDERSFQSTFEFSNGTILTCASIPITW